MSDGVEVRLLGLGDASVLDRVDPGVFDDPIDARATRAFLSDPHHHLAVAIADSVVVGMASAVHYEHPDKPAPEMWINEVGVAPSHQGRGLGRAVVGALLDRARALGCAEAWVLTDRDNPKAMRLYAAAGGEAAKADQVMFTFRLRSDG